MTTPATTRLAPRHLSQTLHTSRLTPEPTIIRFSVRDDGHAKRLVSVVAIEPRTADLTSQRARSDTRPGGG